MHQPGRRFVFGLALSRDSFQLIYFDRSGAVESVSVDIHADAIQLVQVIRMLGDNDLSRLGFDPSIYWSDGRQYVDVEHPTSDPLKPALLQYKIQRVLFQRPHMVERGTTCWVVKEAGSEESLLMKDTLQAEDHTGEQFLNLVNVERIPGVAGLLFAAKTRDSSISSLRQDQCITTTGHKNRVFYRLLSQLQGPSICHFQSGVRLLQALRDVVHGASSASLFTFIHLIVL